MGYSKTIVVGFTGKDPEVKILSGGKKVANFSIAVNEPYTSNTGEKKENTEWFDVECWEAKADMVEKYLEKGQELLVEGKLKTVSWEDKSGNKLSKKILVANVVQFCGGIKKAHNATEAKPESNHKADEAQDDLPF